MSFITNLPANFEKLSFIFHFHLSMFRFVCLKWWRITLFYKAKCYSINPRTLEHNIHCQYLQESFITFTGFFQASKFYTGVFIYQDYNNNKKK